MSWLPMRLRVAGIHLRMAHSLVLVELFQEGLRPFCSSLNESFRVTIWYLVFTWRRKIERPRTWRLQRPVLQPI